MREPPDFFRLTGVFSCEFAACCGTGRMLHLVCGVCALLRTGCRAQCFAHAAGVALPAARRRRNAALPYVSYCISHVLASSCMSSLSVARCLLHAWPVVCRLLREVCRMTHVALVSLALSSVVRCTPSVVFSTLSVVRCVLHVACCLARCTSSLLAASCPLHGACCLDVVCCTRRVVRCIFPVACSPSHVVCCLLHSFQFARCCPLRVVCGTAVRQIVSAARSPSSVLCLHFLHCMRSVVCRLFPVACPSVAWRALSVACPTSHLVTLHVSALRVVGCMLHVARPLPHCVACPFLHAGCCRLHR